MRAGLTPFIRADRPKVPPPLIWMSASVKGFRMPAVRGRERMHGGRRPKSLEGGNRGEFAPAAVSGYGDLMRGVDSPNGFRTGTLGE